MKYKDFLDNKIKNYDNILREFNSEHWIEEIALRKMFQFPDYEGSDFADHIYEKKAEILMRVILLNQIYSIGLQQHPTSELTIKTRTTKYKETIDVMAMTERIFVNAKEIDKYAENGDPQAVEIIRDKNSEKYKDAYSFATKYCSFKNPEAFPIVDQNVKKMFKEFAKDKELSKYISDKVKMGEIDKDYLVFKKVHKACQTYISQNTDSEYISCKYTDMFLWQCGKEYLSEKQSATNRSDPK